MRTINFAVFENFTTASKINSSKSYYSIESYDSLVDPQNFTCEIYHGEIISKIFYIPQKLPAIRYILATPMYRLPLISLHSSIEKSPVPIKPTKDGPILKYHWKFELATLDNISENYSILRSGFNLMLMSIPYFSVVMDIDVILLLYSLIDVVEYVVYSSVTVKCSFLCIISMTL